MSILSVSLQGPHQRNLLKNLLKDYNRMERPVGNDSHTLTVHFSLSLIQIMDVVGLRKPLFIFSVMNYPCGDYNEEHTEGSSAETNVLNVLMS